jgi:hypothetical protein
MYFANENDGDGVFWSLDKDNQPIRSLTISSPYVMLLPNISIDQLRSNYKVLLRHFNAPLPYPTVATTNPKFDPYNHVVDRLSRGPWWGHHARQLNDYGLAFQMERLVRQDLDRKLVCGLGTFAVNARQKALYAVNKNGAHEHFNPLTFEGQRKRVGKDFAWTHGVRTMLPVSFFEELMLRR